MTGHDDFDRMLARWFEAEAVSPAPAGGLERIVAATRPRRPRPGWLAGLGSHWVAEAVANGSSSGVGAIPRLGLRLATALALLLLMAALLGGAILIGARLLQPAPLPAGQLGHLAYVLDGDVYVADWDGKDPLRIADGLPDLDGPSPCGTFWGEGPMWSPDGRYLAYRSDHGDPCPGTVHISDAEGRRVASVPGIGWRVSWSPDSTRVATWLQEEGTIGVYGIDGLRQAVITLPSGYQPRGDYDPAWSPDGRSLLMKLASSDGAGWMPLEVWELPLDGGAARPVPANDPRAHWPVRYSPDGNQAAFIDDGSLVVSAADGSRARGLTSDPTFFLDPLWSPTGDRIAFGWTDEPFDGSSGPYTHELRVVDVATGTVTILAGVRGIAGIARLAGIAFSPEGDRILFSGPGGLWSVDADGSNAHLLVSGTSWGDWQWQPAGS